MPIIVGTKVRIKKGMHNIPAKYIGAVATVCLVISDTRYTTYCVEFDDEDISSGSPVIWADEIEEIASPPTEEQKLQYGFRRCNQDSPFSKCDAITMNKSGRCCECVANSSRRCAAGCGMKQPPFHSLTKERCFYCWVKL